MRFAEKLIPDATILRLRRTDESLDNIKQFYTVCQNSNEKYRAISNICRGVTIGQAMIFCQTRNTASWLSTQLTKDGHPVALLTGDLTVEERLAVRKRFRDAKERILITTNLMTRGMNAKQVTLVVNYDLPMDGNRRPDSETFLNRVEQTGSFDKAGIAVSLVDSSSALENLRQIEYHFGKPIIKLDAENLAELELL